MDRIKLKDVTLFGVDSVDIDRLIVASELSQKFIQFGDVKLLSHIKADCTDVVRIDPITSLEQYSHFMIKEAYKYADTKYLLVIQYDGFVLNPWAWSDEFLEYDYIGGPWWWVKNHSVGNGGFSLRSRRLMEEVALDENIKECHPEDVVICRTWGEYLKQKGFKFAPEDIAHRFSTDGGKWKQQFGFHGADISDWEIEKFADVERHAEYIKLFYEIRGSIAEYVAPATDLEGQLVTIWEDLLGVERVGVLDNFFVLGGDSRRIIKLLSRIRKLNYDIELSDLLSYETVRGLAAFLKKVKVNNG
ncbi:DUF5672 family protein [Puia dinghuensis]|uniref:Carrier domain-containing protein n=1 Tax=Puia dinghuensis TaxID=1792502 RepID=A0A8J2XQJ1_9BACT|nr:DUF5672 family protein [Puia dinghuensis]GGA93639.1 hypothetical protein GCM10011511_16160 [Puia dinghuensis]